MSFSVVVTGPDQGAAQTAVDAIADRLAARNVPVEVLDPRTPGIDTLAGEALERCVAFACGLLARHGVATVVALPMTARSAREQLRTALGRMIEVYVRPLGAGAPSYEAPERPEVELDPGGSVEPVLRTLEVLELLPRAGDQTYTDEEEREVIRRLKAFGYL